MLGCMCNLPVHKHENDDSGIAAKMLLRKRNSSAHPFQGSAISPGISPLVPTYGPSVRSSDYWPGGSEFSSYAWTRAWCYGYMGPPHGVGYPMSFLTYSRKDNWLMEHRATRCGALAVNTYQGNFSAPRYLCLRWRNTDAELKENMYGTPC